MGVITFYRGRTASLVTQITDQDEAPRNITGALVFLRLREEGAPVDESSLSLGIGAGITVDDAVTGLISIKMTPEQTAGLHRAIYHYELYVRFPDGEISTAEIGVFKFLTPIATIL